MKDLIPIQNPDLPALFSPGGLDALIETIEKDARSVVPDIRTRKGRDAIASTAARVARSKTYLDGIGKDFVSDLKAKAKAVDSVRKDMRDRLDALKEEVRKPLSEFEQAEKDRKEAHRAHIAAIHQCDSRVVPGRTASEEISRVLHDLESTKIDDSWEEFQDDAKIAKDAAMFRVKQALESAKEREAREHAEAEERARIAAEEKRKHEERIAREAAQKAKREAEEEAKRKIEAARKAAEEAKARQEREAREHAEHLERLRKEAEERAQMAEEKARQEEAARRKRIEEEHEAQRLAEEARKQDEAHRYAVQAEICQALITLGEGKSLANLITSKLVAGEIPHISVNY